MFDCWLCSAYETTSRLELQGCAKYSVLRLCVIEIGKIDRDLETLMIAFFLAA